MVGEQIESFITRLIKKTKKGKLKWQLVQKMSNWEVVKEQIVKTREVNLKDYFIDDEKSYGMHKCGGYVMILRLQYGNAPVFSDALYKYILVVKINDDLLPQNLSKYDCEGYKDLLQELTKSIEAQMDTAYFIPDLLYDFLGKF